MGFVPMARDVSSVTKSKYKTNISEPSSPVSYLKMISDFLKSEKVSEEMLKRPRLMTFENLAQTDNLLKENRIKLYEDILEAKNEMKLTDSTSKKVSDASYNQRGRFMSI